MKSQYPEEKNNIKIFQPKQKNFKEENKINLGEAKNLKKIFLNISL